VIGKQKKETNVLHGAQDLISQLGLWPKWFFVDQN